MGIEGIEREDDERRPTICGCGEDREDVDEWGDDRPMMLYVDPSPLWWRWPVAVVLGLALAAALIWVVP